MTGPSARARLGLAGRRVILFVGRIQPLKGVGLAVRCLAELEDPDVTLLIVGGPSGVDGEAELARTRALVEQLGVEDRVRFVPPQPHAQLAEYYRAADVCLVPSRTESFGLVALEAAACGTPVVAASVGGLRSLVDDAAHRLPRRRSRPRRLRDADRAPPRRRRSRGRDERERGRRSRVRYSWSATAGRLRRSYSDLAARALVRCD